MAKNKSSKDVSKAGSKIELKPESSSVRFKPNPVQAKTMPKEAKEAADIANRMVYEKRKAEEKGTTSKSALKAANKTPKLSKNEKEIKAEAQRLSDERAKKAVAEAKENPKKNLTTEEKYAYRRSMDRPGTQAGHSVTRGRNFTKSGGSFGGGGGRIGGDFLDQTK